MTAGDGPGPPAAEQEQLQALKAAVKRAELPLEELWLRYFAVGGAVGPVEVEAYLQGLMGLPEVQRDMLAHAANERLDELNWSRRVPYLRTVKEAGPGSGALSALVGLFDGSRLAPPERLVALAEAAAWALGIQVEIYLVDDEQQWLVPLRSPGAAAGPVLAVDGTTAGRAYQSGEMLPADPQPVAATADGAGAATAAGTDHLAGVDDSERLWVPLLDGLNRLGVLDVRMADAADVGHPAMREQCRWLSALLGQLATRAARHGDPLPHARRRRPGGPAADVIRGLLPPMTAGTELFVVAGLLATGEDGGGDAFDYALAETHVTFAIFDGAVRAPGSALVMAAVLAAYRRARRDGLGLLEQARVIDETVAAYPNGTGCTGVLAELDLITGRLLYLLAGHPPPPRLCRDGEIRRTLSSGQRPPLGAGDAHILAASAFAEETLRPGDRVVLSTGGVTAARNRQGSALGEDGFTVLLEAEVAAARPPAEAARRLIQGVLDHQHGTLPHDAAVLLACWQNPPAT